MTTVLSEFELGLYKVLTIDEEKPTHKYTKYLIGKKLFDIVPVYDMNDCIAVETSDSLVGKVVEFV